MSAIFLTGATGFLGSHIAEALVGAGYRVTCSVRASSDTRWIDPLGVDQVELDLGLLSPLGSEATEDREAAGLGSSLAGFDAVIHCAGLTRARNEAQFMAVNAIATGMLARAAADAGVGRFVLISSLAARGPDGAAGPISPYGRSKAAGEATLADLGGPMTTLILRPGGVYGPRDSDLLPLFKLVARGWTVIPRSKAPLQPVYVTDVVSAVLSALDATATGDPLPIAADDVHSWPQLADSLRKSVGRPGRVVSLPPALFWLAGALAEVGARFIGSAPAMDRRRARDMSVHAWTCDTGPTRRALAPWRPSVGIEEGLTRTAAWYREAGWL